tara:strand:+ start:27 stop:272 length:246 start_codon:yes stop_codon:yes gene_type:complete
MQDKNKNKLLDKLAATSWGVRAGPPKKKHYGESWRAHPKKNNYEEPGRAHPKKNIMGSPGGPTQKKNKKILVKVAVQVKTT